VKRILLAGAAALLLAGSASAQTTVTTTTGTSVGSTITIAPEQRTKIKQYVVQQKVKPITVKEKITVGATLPQDVELQAVPSDWGADVSRYQYVYYGDDVMLVEPSSRRVVQVID
jgi:hypothetical protein